MTDKGKVYIMGAGPGDLELLTLKGKRAVEEADCIVYDRLINPRILNFAKKDAEMIYLGKGNTEGGVIQDEINKTIVQKALEGKIVARVKGGDPFVFGRGGEEIQSLYDNNIPFEIIPGITSSISVPAYAGIPVTHRGIARSFHVFTGHTMEDGTWHNFEAIAKLEGTLVFLMGIKTLPIIVTDLISNGKCPDTPVAIIEKGATSDQRVTVGTLNTIVDIAKERKIVPPAITIIGEVVNLRDTFKWFEEKNLFGKKILVTRDKKQAGEFSDKIEKVGGIAVELPFIEIESTIETISKDMLQDYSAILFNSPNGVREFMNKVDDVRILAHLKIGAVGSKTKELLENYKLKADFMPDEYLVSKLAELSIEHTKPEDKILIITSDISPCDTEKFNSIYDRTFYKMVAYNTKKIIREKDEVLKALSKIEIVTFLSSSTVDAFYESIDGDIKAVKDKKFASIGPVTSDTMRKYGFTVDHEAAVYDVNGILEAVK
ncbi:uroporphyrinogen-III C-methyltransferase [Fusobacterium sp.]|uniref:uroporphyrinogen-III C-methyltransferase n=1 Tax=Fusobacterium sp. TaxID=68766 RepID=UPI0029035F39|nr:uroporphyrinogen-III C-methyltransferase [Fusobacterium sp.]MDU1912406.1 uroporphyrinogen-III C-methyltransferase [Fusobacterium sp.]